VPPAVDGEADCSENVHPLIDGRLAGEPPDRQKQIGKQDQRRAGPTGDFDRDLLSAQAASLLST
jgi:hypothetical protein